MTAFFIAEVAVTDPSWIPEYAGIVHDIAAKHGGKYLSRSGAIDTLEGPENEDTVIAIIQFPDKASALAFANDPDYAPYKKAREDGANSRIRLIDDSDLAGGIPYLPAGG